MIQIDELPVTPKRWIVTKQKGSRHHSKQPQVLAAVMPRPTLSGHEPCAGDPRFTTDKDKMTAAERLQEERELRELCLSCPVLTACREWAIAHDKYNYTGGMSAQDREAERRNRNQVYVEPHNAAIYGLDVDHFTPSARTCKHGHAISSNTAHFKRTDNGRLVPVCTVCYDSAQDAAIAANAARRRKAS